MKNIVIIGNGISGVTLARHIRKLSKHNITIISNETDYFFSRTALMYVFMGHMKFEHTQPYENNFWKKNNINLLNEEVVEIETKSKTLQFASKKSISYDVLVLATGSKPNKMGWPGQDANGVLGLYHKQDLDKLEILAKNSKKAVVVGGGLIGIEMVEMLHSRNIPVTFLVRENSFWANVLPEKNSQLVTKHIHEHHIDLKLNSSLKSIITDENGRAKAIVTNNDEIIEADIVGLTIGVSPNIEFLQNTDIKTNRGILVNEFLETNIENIYAIGDCAEQQNPNPNRRPIEAVWYTGRMMGETLAQTICGKKMPYNPGNWFNSAKFFDIEYQTYGWVYPEVKENESIFHWEASCGKKAITMVFYSQNKQFLGVNTFGIRLKHEFFDTVLNQKQTINYVLDHFKQANFDPEFFKTYEKEINLAFKQQFNTLKSV